MPYILFADASCDLPVSFIQESKIEVVPMEFVMEGKRYNHYPDYREMSYDLFYHKLQNGVLPQTSQINSAVYIEQFEPYLKKGTDVLYLCFSSGMSGSYNSCLIAVSELKKQYPQRKIIVVDSLCASSGYGYFIYQVFQKINENLDIEAIAEYAESIKLNCCHWFIVDDLEYLKRGGRISTITATFGKALNIKPLISLDNEGRLVSVGKIRGIQKAYETLIEKMKRDADNYSEQTVFVAHSYAPEHVQILKERLDPMVKKVVVCEIGPIVGTHVGPSLFAIVFMGRRNWT